MAAAPPQPSSSSSGASPVRVVAHAVFAIQGRRDTMEDRHILIPDPHLNQASKINSDHTNNKRALFGVLDGHGGDQCADFVEKRLPFYLTQNQSLLIQNPQQALESAIEKTDNEFASLCQRNSDLLSAGSTAILALMDQQRLIIANIGDSRAVLSSNGLAVPLSQDHKPDRPDEKLRIEAAGGVVARSIEEAEYLLESPFKRKCMDIIAKCFCTTSAPPQGDGPNRIFPGGIAVARAFGDHELKQSKLLTSQPEITVHNLTSQDQFLILACDGLWDVLSCQDAVNLVLLNWHLGPDEAVRQLVATAYTAGSFDNISAVLITFQAQPSGPPVLDNQLDAAPQAPSSGFLQRQVTLLPGQSR